MHAPKRRIRQSCLLLFATSLVVALSGCGGGGGGMPEPPMEMLPLPIGHGLSAGEITVPPGTSKEHGNVVIYCPAGDEACVLNVAADGSASYPTTGGMPSLTFPVRTRMAAALSQYPEQVRRNVAARVGVAGDMAVVSSTAATTDIDPVTGGNWNTGVTQATHGADNRAINARYLRGRLVFERINFGLGLVHGTGREPEPPGYVETIPATPDAPRWKGVEHFVVSPSGGKYYSIFYSDIENNDDADYLALGFWAWLPGPGSSRIPFVGAAASGNDPFLVAHVTPVAGLATYEGAANGLYANGGAIPVFKSFGAAVLLTADFDQDSIGGTITGGKDSATGEPLFEELMMEGAPQQTSGAAFFSGTVRGLVKGEYMEGSWGGQLYGNGTTTTDVPVSYAEAPGSVAGTFGARADGGGGTLIGVFRAHRE